VSNVCPLCRSAREKIFNTIVLKKHAVDYFYCKKCGLLQTQEPFWLEEAYADAIAVADTGLVARNQGIARKLSALLYWCFDRQGRYIDVAGGYGLLTRLMRDVGFDFYWHDIYCDNLFARGFEAVNVGGSVAAITAFEVLEHVTDPLDFIMNCLRESDTSTIILSTELFQGTPPIPKDWWYYAPDTGQHISFYQLRTLQWLASNLSLRLYSHRNIHVLTNREIDKRLFRLATSKASWIGYVWARARMDSLTFPDHLHICRLTDPTDVP
jgi:hypothetical protein